MPQASPATTQRNAAGAPEKRNNYEIAVEQAKQLFLSYDQAEICRRMARWVTADDTHLFVTFCGLPYRICRTSGTVERAAGDAWEAANFSEAFGIWDFVCRAREGAQPAGALGHRRPNAFRSEYAYDSVLTPHATAYFNEHVGLLRDACAQLGELETGSFDVGARIHVFDGICTLFHFWEGDDEFEPCFKFIWDANIEDFIAFETTYYVQGHITSRLVELMKLAEAKG